MMWFIVNILGYCTKFKKLEVYKDIMNCTHTYITYCDIMDVVYIDFFTMHVQTIVHIYTWFIACFI